MTTLIMGNLYLCIICLNSFFLHSSLLPSTLLPLLIYKTPVYVFSFHSLFKKKFLYPSFPTCLAFHLNLGKINWTHKIKYFFVYLV